MSKVVDVKTIAKPVPVAKRVDRRGKYISNCYECDQMTARGTEDGVNAYCMLTPGKWANLDYEESQKGFCRECSLPIEGTDYEKGGPKTSYGSEAIVTREVFITIKVGSEVIERIPLEKFIDVVEGRSPVSSLPESLVRNLINEHIVEKFSSSEGGVG